MTKTIQSLTMDDIKAFKKELIRGHSEMADLLDRATLMIDFLFNDVSDDYMVDRTA